MLHKILSSQTQSLKALQVLINMKFLSRSGHESCQQYFF